MSGYDKIKDEIFGCRYMDMAWWHEKGHQELSKNNAWKEIEMFNQYVFIFTIAFLILNWNIAASWTFLVWIGIFMFDEWYAWIYCFKNKKRWVTY